MLVLLQGSLTKLRAESDALATEKEECQSGMNDLKALLYAKFGSESTVLMNMRTDTDSVWEQVLSIWNEEIRRVVVDGK